MKRIALVVAFISCALYNVAAQSDQKLSLGVGVLSHAYLKQFVENFTIVDYWFPGEHDHGTYRYQDRFMHSVPLTASLHYECTVGKHFGFGMCFTYDYMRMHHDTEIWTENGTTTRYDGEICTQWEISNETGSIYRHTFNLMPEVTIYWFKKRHVALYSQVAAGIRFNVEKETIDYSNRETTSLQEKHFTCHISVAGVEVGGSSWRGYATLGYGAQGISQIGVKHTFQGINKGEKDED